MPAPTIELTDEFARAIDIVKRERGSLFVTGRAGTGKSTLLTALRETVSLKTAVVAPTGLAAINVGGQTIHSLFSLPPRLITPDMIRRGRNARLLKRLELLVIDEVSMVRADLMDAIDRTLRLVRGEPDQPFGGVQLAMFGDPHQLPPIVQRGEMQHYFAETYGGPFFFNAPVFGDAGIPRLELSEIFRQRDEAFIRVLNAVRDGEPDPATMEPLNARVCQLAEMADPTRYVVLTPTNAAANAINMGFLGRLAGEPRAFEALVSGEFSEGAFPTDRVLQLKVGARVILLRNDPDGRWVNGTMASVTALTQDTATIDIDGDEHTLEPEVWENVHYAFDQTKDKIVETVAGKFRQLPLRLAWALTIHKSQGMTLDRVYINLGRGTFSHGQCYVALSRCRSLEGLAMARPLRPSDIIFDPAATGYRSVFEELGPD